jgi:hypothetical protein
MPPAWILLVALVALAVPAPAASAAEIPPSGTLDLRILSDLRLEGEQPGARAGTATAPAGDVNGDGISDLVVGAPRHDAGEKVNAGAAWVVFGTGSGAPEPADITTAPGFRIDGAAPFDRAGAAVVGIGDVDGDGLDDVLVGAPLADAAGRTNAGAVYVVLGRAGSEPVDLAAPGGAALVVAGAAAGDRLGAALAALPDANGDGRPDLVAGAPRADRADVAVGGDQAYVSEPPIPADAGAAFVLFTPDLSRAPAQVDTAALGTQGYRIDGARGRAGKSVAVLPDWNGDGLAEIAIGAPRYRRNAKLGGRAYVVWGSGSARPVDVGGLGGRGILLDGGGAQRAGGAVASVGDLGGDARGDLAVGADYAGRRARRAAGRVTIVYARSASGSLELGELGDGGVRIDGERPGDHAGVSISAAGDVDGDGRDDAMIGAHGADALDRTDAGAAYVVYGGGHEPAIDLAFVGTRGFRIAGAEPGDRLGRAVAVAGDPSGDGRTDLALGSPRSAKQSGALTLVHGPRPPVADPVEQLPADPGAGEELTLDGCRAVMKLGVIVDDSGSMSEFDPRRLRVAALELLLDKERNVGERLGAVEFGDVAEQLFPPVLVGGETFERDRRMLARLIDERVQSDAGGTNYNAGFKGAQRIDPDAQAVVFITDGGHNVGRFRALHRTGPPTFVIGVGIGRDGRDGRRLQRIADETDGAYFPDVDADELQPIINRIDAGLNCDTDIATAADRVEDREAPSAVDEPLGEGTRSADVVVSWDDPLDDVALGSLTVLRGGKRIARFGAASLRRAADDDREPQRNGVRIDGTLAQTYLSLRVNGVEGGRIRLRFLRADLHGDARERIVTQVSESRRRR